MAEENDSQEKTEDPSQRKLDKAREEGRVLSSKEMFVFTGMLAGLAIISMVPIFGGRILQTWASLFVFDHPEILDGAWLSRMELVFWNFLMLMAIIAVPIVLVVLMTQLAVGGINFSAKALSFKGSRINPVSGLGRIFSVKGLVELGKSLLKVGLLFGIATVVIYQFIPRVIPLTQSTMNQALEMMLFGLQVLI